MAAMLAQGTVDMVGPFQAALQQSNVSQKAMAALMGISEQQLCQQLRLQGHLSLARLLHAARDDEGRRFLRAFFPRLAAASGQPELAELLRVADAFGRLMDVMQRKLASVEFRPVAVAHDRRVSDRRRVA